jgi:hypothetical protein
MDNVAKKHGYRDFAELATKVNVKSVDDAIKLIKAILAYRECKKVLEATGQQNGRSI